MRKKSRCFAASSMLLAAVRRPVESALIPNTLARASSHHQRSRRGAAFSAESWPAEGRAACRLRRHRSPNRCRRIARWDKVPRHPAAFLLHRRLKPAHRSSRRSNKAIRVPCRTALGLSPRRARHRQAHGARPSAGHLHRPALQHHRSTRPSPSRAPRSRLKLATRLLTDVRA